MSPSQILFFVEDVNQPKILRKLGDVDLGLCQFFEGFHPIIDNEIS
jgi:hypothetical protein